MSFKKKFSIAADLASGLRNTVELAATKQGHLHFDMMPLDNIMPDPKNPRILALTYEEMINGIISSGNNQDLKQNELEALMELSNSIKKVGVKNPIEVYKDGVKYRIITGERRYWASLLAGLKSIPTRISPKPEEFILRYTQWIENINRRDLSLLEKLHNLQMIAEAYEKTNQTPFTEKNLQQVLGSSSIQAYRYYCLLKADKRILDLIESGKLNNLKIVQELASMKDKSAQKQIISWIASCKKEITSLSAFKEAVKPKFCKILTKGSQRISLGRVSNSNTVKYLFEAVLSHPKIKKYEKSLLNIEWSSSKSVSSAVKELLSILEKEFKEIENVE